MVADAVGVTAVIVFSGKLGLPILILLFYAALAAICDWLTENIEFECYDWSVTGNWFIEMSLNRLDECAQDSKSIFLTSLIIFLNIEW